jgi:hypothetical protein
MATLNGQACGVFTLIDCEHRTKLAVGRFAREDRSHRNAERAREDMRRIDLTWPERDWS